MQGVDGKDMILVRRRLGFMSRLVVLLAGVIPLLLSGLLVPALAATKAPTKATKAKAKAKATATETDNWGVYQHDASHSGRSNNIAPSQPVILWIIQFGTSGKPSSPIVVAPNGNFYVGVDVTPLNKESSSTSSTKSSMKESSGHSGLFAFSPDKKVLWVSKVTGKVTGPPAVGKDAIYAVIGTTLAALNKDDGSVKWQLPLNGEAPGGVTLDKDGTLYVGTLKGQTLYTVSSDGKIKWQYAAGGQIDGSPAIGNDGVVYFTSQDLYLTAINPGGSLKWKFKVPKATGSIQLSPSIIAPDGTVYFGMSRDAGILTQQDDDARQRTGVMEKGRLYAIKPDGSQKWCFDAEGKTANMPALEKDGTIIFSTTSIDYTPDRQYWQGDCYVEAVTPDGTKIWRFNSTDSSLDGPVIIDGRDNIYASSTDGYLTCITKTDTMVWRAKVGGKVAIGPKGILYVAAKSSVGAVSQRDVNKEAKESQQIQNESDEGSSSYGASLLIYIIPIAMAIGIGFFIKTRMNASAKNDGEDSE